MHKRSRRVSPRAVLSIELTERWSAKLCGPLRCWRRMRRQRQIADTLKHVRPKKKRGSLPHFHHACRITVVICIRANSQCICSRRPMELRPLAESGTCVRVSGFSVPLGESNLSAGVIVCDATQPGFPRRSIAAHCATPNTARVSGMTLQGLFICENK